MTVSRCGPCKLVHKEIVRLDMMLPAGSVDILSVNIDVEKQFAADLAVTSVPTLMFVGTAPPDVPALMTKVMVHMGVD